MALAEEFIDEGDIDPIDITENIVDTNKWDYDRLSDDQIAFAVEKQWRTYSITLAWSPFDSVLRLVCTYEVEPPEEKIDDLYKMIHEVNDRVWGGSFTYWSEQSLMVWRYGLILTDKVNVSPEQIQRMIDTATYACEQYYPGFALMLWSDSTIEQAFDACMCKAYGTA